ncbi:hypothetical protein B0G71_0326 [Paraburkholderia sp. BL27I4N3]|nr:hypothetical protein B0G71_0326 [Paraburkholderia sp. BL27I4N3]RKR44352.1 hypothetical protein B0G82_1957 [Paraburkholderia sp. BL17N1]
MAPPDTEKPEGFDPTVPTSAEREAGRMIALSQTWNVREHRFQMHHYRNCAGAPLKH